MQDYRIETTDVLVIGAGITGLRAALEASANGKDVLVLSKGPRCSWGIGGFNAAAGSNDSTELYYQDILKSGTGLSDRKLAAILAAGSMDEVRYLQTLGMTFDRKNTGEYDLLRPLGCTVPRLVHRESKTGKIAEDIFLALLQQRGVEVRTGVTAIELLSDGAQVYGALGIERGHELICYEAKAVIMAAGGCGHMYPVSTYPAGIQGDSYGMLARAGCELIDMEFMQFEPCCLVEPSALRGHGISTTMLSAGAVLRNAEGKEFLGDYFDSPADVQKGELARAIYSESQKYNGQPVEYDLTPLTSEEIDAHCIYSEQLKEMGYDASIKPLKILPAAHTFLGGARVDENCATSLHGLYAAGEAMGGLHGANRIGGCAGAETFVFGAVAGRHALRFAESQTEPCRKKTQQLVERVLNGYLTCGEKSIDPCRADDLNRTLQDSMVKHLYLVREEQGIKEAIRTASEIEHEARLLRRDTGKNWLEANRLENAAITVRLIAESSLRRKESRGVFFRSDYPECASYTVSYSIKKQGEQITVQTVERV